MSPLFPWFGEVLTLMRVYEGPVPESGREGNFIPSHFTIWHLQEGGFRIVINRETIRFAAPAWVLMPPGPRRQVADAGTRMMSIHFQLDARALANLGWPPVLYLDGVGGALSAKARTLLATLKKARLGPSLVYLPAVPVGLEEFLAVQGTFLNLLGTLLGILAPQLHIHERRDIDPRLLSVRNSIAALPLESPPNFHAVASQHGLSLRQINRLHKQTFTGTCNEYWEQLRVKSARIGLANPSLPIKQVALSLGFTDLAFFSNWFLRHELCRPREFRARLLESLRHRAT